jgi:hypothetical protein
VRRRQGKRRRERETKKEEEGGRKREGGRRRRREGGSRSKRGKAGGREEGREGYGEERRMGGSHQYSTSGYSISLYQKTASAKQRQELTCNGHVQNPEADFCYLTLWRCRGCVLS